LNFDVVLDHLYLVLMASLFATIIGLVLGVIVYMFKKVRPLILQIIDIIQTIPALAILGILMIFFGGNSTTVIIGLVFYSLLPIVRNTYVGLEGIDPSIKEAAKGMGMTKMQRLFMVELGLAFPMIFTGIRIAVVTSIGTAVFGAFIGGGGLGSTINRAILIQDISTLMWATASLMVMAIIFDYGMGFLEKRFKARV